MLFYKKKDKYRNNVFRTNYSFQNTFVCSITEMSKTQVPETKKRANRKLLARMVIGLNSIGYYLDFLCNRSLISFVFEISNGDFPLLFLILGSASYSNNSFISSISLFFTARCKTVSPFII